MPDNATPNVTPVQPAATLGYRKTKWDHYDYYQCLRCPAGAFGDDGEAQIQAHLREDHGRS